MTTAEVLTILAELAAKNVEMAGYKSPIPASDFAIVDLRLAQLRKWAEGIV